MAQGDAFIDGVSGSTSANSVLRYDVTAASGNHIKLYELSMGYRGHGSNGHAHAIRRDYGSATTIGVHVDSQESWYPNLLQCNQGSGANDGRDSRYGSSVVIDDTLGIRFEFDNKSCSSGPSNYSLSGIQVK